MLWDKLKGHRFYNRIVLLAMIITGLLLLVYPVTQDRNAVMYSDGFYGDQFTAIVGYAPPGDFATVHLTSGNGVLITLQIALNGVYTPIFTDSFPAGTVDVPNTSVGTGGTVFLTIASNNRVFTPMNIQARIFQEVATYPYIPLGIGTLGVAAVFATITRIGRVPFHSIQANSAPKLRPATG